MICNSNKLGVRTRFLENLLFCSVDVDDDAVLEDCRRSSIQLLDWFDIVFIEFVAGILLIAIDVLDDVTTIVSSKLSLALFVFCCSLHGVRAIEIM